VPIRRDNKKVLILPAVKPLPTLTFIKSRLHHTDRTFRPRREHMSKMKRFKEIERSLGQRADSKIDTVITLENEDFKDGKLTLSGYDRLKHECEFIGYKEDIEIIVPKENGTNFKGTLESMVSVELSRIKVKGRSTHMQACVWMLAGIICFLIGTLFRDTTMIKDITIIAAWVFIWTAVGKWFFDLTDLRDKKYSLIHILTAKIIAKQ
jgi:hypothetical protein